jgi:hypothetical protein
MNVYLIKSYPETKPIYKKLDILSKNLTKMDQIVYILAIIPEDFKLLD